MKRMQLYDKIRTSVYILLNQCQSILYIKKKFYLYIMEDEKIFVMRLNFLNRGNNLYTLYKQDKDYLRMVLSLKEMIESQQPKKIFIELNLN